MSKPEPQQSEAIWIDVRTPEENAARQIEGHINIPYELIAERINELNLSPDQVIKLYCRTGRRSGIAAQTLQELGFKHAENVGGFEDACEALDI